MNEFSEFNYLIAKHEKKMLWTKEGVMNLFDNLNNIPTY